MKSINKFIGLALLSGALLTSCSDSFLQRDSLTESSSNTFWQTPDDALMALASCYDALQSNQHITTTDHFIAIFPITANNRRTWGMNPHNHIITFHPATPIKMTAII